MTRPADEEMIGRNVGGKFLVEKLLGGGAMGAVYKAYQASIEKHVAIKVLHRQFVLEPSFVSRFEREAKAASLLDHSNLMRVIDYGREADGVCYIAMELLEGRSLYQVIKEDSPLADARIAGLVRQTLAGLAVAHEMGIIHRDLKPENIIVLEKFDDDGRRAELVKVCDFGMAKLVTPEHDDARSASSEKLTSHGVVVGTPDYMSPEQGKGERLDARSDIYAVGVILYQMLTKKLPFSAETPIATLLRQVMDQPQAPSAIAPNVHPGLEAVCLRALSKRREDRFQTAREMRAEIRAVIEGRGGAGPQARLALESFPDAEFSELGVDAPPVPRSVRLSQSPGLTPPQSHRVRAVEALREEPRSSRAWAGPVVAALVIGIGAGAFLVTKHRRAEGAAARSVQIERKTTATPTASPTTKVESTPAESPRPAVQEIPSADSKGALVPPSNAPPAASLAVRGASKAETPMSAAPPPVTQAFGVLAVPEVPKVAGVEPSKGPDAGGLPLTVPSPPPPADPSAHAHVALGGVHGERIKAADVLAALTPSRFERCYRSALAAQGSLAGGQGTLHLVIDSDGHVGSASFAGPAHLASVGQCIAEAAVGGDVKHVEDGVTGADVDLSFRPE